MSEDGQGWVYDELENKLVGLAHRTPRVQCRTTDLLSYHGDLCEGTKSKRCGRLDLDLGWEATCRNDLQKRFTGKARVTMENKDAHDVVDVAVDVDPACLAALPEERGGLVADVVYAVESLDAAIMEKLNDFLWDMEQRNRMETQAQGEESGEAQGPAFQAA
ncbi:hypothetical protein GPECTOR_8g190 [Gonium pectorale]|uniref:Activator of Hsp90 ATPase N-terminal domain-containing protein n=1 Tax=Gonium pectorale TaxID=33097 RepID=A0A150GSP9_GONPE|nr:hypothetical protein GPECTOR_8g190 [Gonium pectorale]|eukprot:KXZ52804.1 hypothetical protein GPECTOR_8g190 [Gonium pectorale]